MSESCLRELAVSVLSAGLRRRVYATNQRFRARLDFDLPVLIPTRPEMGRHCQQLALHKATPSPPLSLVLFATGSAISEMKSNEK